MRIQRATVALAVTALLGALALPLLEVALANASAPLCAADAPRQAGGGIS